MNKLIYLTKRRKGLSHDTFTRRWRMHGARGMSVDMWKYTIGYIQAEVIRPIPLKGLSDEYDGVACNMSTDESATCAFDDRDIREGMMLVQDETETFSASIQTTLVWVEEERLRPGPLGGFTAFLFFLDKDEARRVASFYSADHRATRLTLNHKRSEVGMRTANGLPYDAIIEISAPTLPILKDILGSASKPSFRDADVAVVTREAVLWDRMDTA